MNTPGASVVILTLNAGPGFESLLRRVFSQRTGFGYEVLVVDSGSTDGTVELANRYGASVHGIDPKEFGHGATRNLGAALASGRYVVYLVQDALPVDDGWLAAMVADLDADETVAGAYGRQIPRPDSSRLTRTLMRDWPTSAPERREQSMGGPDLYGSLPPSTRRSLAVFDNVSSCVRRSVWERFPFECTGFGEDVRWGKSVVEAGYKLVYDPRSTVLHSHERGAIYDLRRHYADTLVLGELFGLPPRPSLLRLLWNMIRASAYLYLRREGGPTALDPLFLPSAFRYALCSQTGTYLAARRLHRPGTGSRIDRFLMRGI